MSRLADLHAPGALCLGLIISLMIAWIPAAHATSDESRSRRWVSARLTTGGWLSSIDGYLQTPTGGRAGSTSQRRPTFSEIALSGLDVLPSIDAELTLLEDHSLSYNYFSTDRDGRATLDKDLTSQGQLFPRGSEVESDYDSTLMRLGYRARWLDLLGLFELEGWNLLPEIGYAVFDFHYQLESPGIVPVDRKYDVEFPYLGLLLEAPIRWGKRSGNALQLETELLGSGWINGVSYIDADIRFVIRFYEAWKLRFSLVSGMRGVWMRRKDSQSDEQNDINARFGAFADNPWGGLHLGLRIALP